MINPKHQSGQQYSGAKTRPLPSAIYTYNLPYGTRKSICNLLDADQSWRTLGGQYLGLNVTELTLIGQAYLRNGSPTEELLNKLDSANVKVAEFCFYLQQINHYRALDILKPFNYSADQTSLCGPSPMSGSSHDKSKSDATLDTPTPSFTDQQPATILAANPFTGPTGGLETDWMFSQDQFLPLPIASRKSDDKNHYHQLAENRDYLPSKDENMMTDKQQQLVHLDLFQQRNFAQNAPPGSCHNNRNSALKRQPLQLDQQPVDQQLADPGEEIVRLACANNRKRTSISDQEVVNQLRLIMQITYNELKQASNSFAQTNILGNGGFASVYRGNWKGTDVAIKRLKCNLMDQALNELTILNSYRIDNILPIYGISIDGPEACLVYQFMANGSLEDRLSCKKGTRPLTWAQRAHIGEGVAKGLFYLHTLRDKPLVHGDVKSANVLLDSQFVPKLGDFGLARQVFKAKNPQSELCTHCTVSSIHGTSVYLPSEYLRHKILSPAVDVYSYGIVLLEMATGKRAYDGKKLLIDLVEDETRSMSTGQINYNLKDYRLTDETQSDRIIWLELLIKLGLNCAHKIKKRRPDMGKVLSRFVDFRSSSDSARGATLSSINGTILSGFGSTTVCTTTPGDLNHSTPPQNYGPDWQQQQHQQQVVAHQQPIARTPQFNPEQDQVSLVGHVTPVTNQSLKLMSVEEEETYQEVDNVSPIADLTTGEHDRAVRINSDQLKDLQSERAVEDMIPLLTELGIVANQDQ